MGEAVSIQGRQKEGLSTIAEAMETVRQKMIIFRYQLLHIKSGKAQITNTLQIVRSDLKQYEDIVKQLKATIRERRTLLEERKTTPTIQIFRHQELAQRIAALTENIEDLKSERTLLLNQFDSVDDHGMAEVKQRIASMESSLEKLDQREKKYTAELDAALAQYAEMQQQTSDIDTMELDMVRQAIRPNRERETVQQLQTAYGKRFDSGMLAQGRKDVAHMLDETMEPVSVRQNLQHLYEHQDRQYHVKKHDQEH